LRRARARKINKRLIELSWKKKRRHYVSLALAFAPLDAFRSHQADIKLRVCDQIKSTDTQIGYRSTLVQPLALTAQALPRALTVISFTIHVVELLKTGWMLDRCC
jgi:hypothetical protein